MKITRRKLGQIIREALLEAPRSSMTTTPGARDREVMIGYPREGFDWNSCINEIRFEPSFDDPDWEDGLVTPSDLVVYAGDGSSASLDGDGSADQSVYVDASVHAPVPRCWIKRDGNEIIMGWGYVPEYNFRKFANDWGVWGSCPAQDSEFDKYPVLKRFSLKLRVEEDEDGEYILDYVNMEDSQLPTCIEGSLWQDDDCEADCCLSTICDDVHWGGRYTRYSGCEACTEEADDCPGEIQSGMIDPELLRR
mgnify:CR=1 FL=1